MLRQLLPFPAGATLAPAAESIERLAPMLDAILAPGTAIEEPATPITE